MTSGLPFLNNGTNLCLFSNYYRYEYFAAGNYLWITLIDGIVNAFKRLFHSKSKNNTA